MSYLDSGFNENLIRRNSFVPATTQQQFDSANIGDLLSGTSIGSEQIKGIGFNKIVTGKFGLIPTSGNTGILFDADNNRIVINDGSNDRIVIGRLVGKF